MTTCDLCTSLPAREQLVTDLLELGHPEWWNTTEEKTQLQEELFSVWARFMQGTAPAQELVRLSITYYEKCHCMWSPGGREDEEEGDSCSLSVEKDQFIRKFVLPLMLDLECRTRFQLALYRMYPKFFVLCCEYAHCFACKVDEWHEGTSCEDKQKHELQIDAQFCPDCSIPTIRTNGCSDMLCVCGSVWEWYGDDDDSDSDY